MTDFSIIIPARNEAANIVALLDGIDAVMCETDYEVIVVDDASNDGMALVLSNRLWASPRLRVLRHDVVGGQSAAIHSGVVAAVSQVCATLDGDGQNPPEELPRLFDRLTTGDAGLVAGQRLERHDAFSKRAASWLANTVRAQVLRDATRDTGCGLKAFRRDAFLALPYFDHMHRYLPALFARDGWKVVHVDVGHRARAGGISHYGNVHRAAVGIVDLIAVAWLLRRRKRARSREILR